MRLAIMVPLLLARLVLPGPDPGWDEFGPRALAPLRVLFIGNSYTYYNNLPAIVAELARAASPARDAQVEMVVAAGATLRDHWTSGEAIAALHRGPWDYVVLQEQSMLGVVLVEGKPSVNEPTFFHTYARLFVREIVAAGATPVFYLTWSRKQSPELQQRLTDGYAAIARETGGLLAPVGLAWQAVRAKRPGLELYDPDGTHPSPAGSYLAAAAIWATLAGSSTQGLPATARGPALVDSAAARFGSTTSVLVTLAEADARLVQGAVDEAVMHRSALPVRAAPSGFLPPLPAGSPLSKQRLAGRWTGSMLLYDAPVDVELSVDTTADGVAAQWKVVGAGWRAAQVLGALAVDSTRLSFSVPDPRFLAPTEYHWAVLVHDTLIGRAEVGSATAVPRLIGSWKLVRTGDPDRDRAIR